MCYLGAAHRERGAVQADADVWQGQEGAQLVSGDWDALDTDGVGHSPWPRLAGGWADRRAAPRAIGGQEPGVDAPRHRVPGGVRAEQGDPLLNALHSYPLLPRLGGQPLEGSEEGRVIGDDEVSRSLHSLIQDRLCQVIGQKYNLKMFSYKT